MRKHIWVDLLLYPTHTLPIAAAPVMVGAALAARDHVFAPMAVVLAFLGSWLIHLAGLFTDTHELLRRHPQAVEHPDSRTPCRTARSPSARSRSRSPRASCSRPRSRCASWSWAECRRS